MTPVQREREAEVEYWHSQNAFEYVRIKIVTDINISWKAELWSGSPVDPDLIFPVDGCYNGWFKEGWILDAIKENGKVYTKLDTPLQGFFLMPEEWYEIVE